MVAEAGTDVARAAIDWSNVSDSRSALDFLLEMGVTLIDAKDVIGDGFEVVQDKDLLINAPFVVLSWRTTDSTKYKGTFVSVMCVGIATTDRKQSDKFVDVKFVFNDGSTGIMKQLHKIEGISGSDSRVEEVVGGLICRNGLRQSTYPYTDKQTGEISQATTYYLA